MRIPCCDPPPPVGEVGLVPSDEPSRRPLSDEPESKIARGRAGRAAPGARIADEVGNIGPMLAFGHADSAIDDRRRQRPTLPVERSAYKASVCPLPNIRREVEQAALIGGVETIEIICLPDNIGMRMSPETPVRFRPEGLMESRAMTPAERQASRSCPLGEWGRGKSEPLPRLLDRIWRANALKDRSDHSLATGYRP